MIKRKPKPWASQMVFFDVVMYNERSVELSRRAAFICKECRHICEWDEDSLFYRCVCCGRKLSTYGAKEVIQRYGLQIDKLKAEVDRSERDVLRNSSVAKRLKQKRD